MPADGAEAGRGIDEALPGGITRSDGAGRLTVRGRPAYRHVQDVDAGDVKGQGTGGKWCALAPPTTRRRCHPVCRVCPNHRDPQLGELAVDGKGVTAYRFMKGEAWPKPVSACIGACLDK